PSGPFVPQADLTTTGLLDFESLTFDDSIRIGVKAANLAELRQLLGDTTPPGFAIPFHYYDQFMQTTQLTASLCLDAELDCVEEGRDAAVCQDAAALCAVSGDTQATLQAYAEEIIGNPDLQSDTLLREAVLDGLRYAIHHGTVDASFGEMLDARVSSLVGNSRARLRSSTNAEDLLHFSGAGLYRSVSSQVGTEIQPSSRVREVWASVWGWAAFEERSYWNIDHLATKMGVAVHRSFPEEEANGVLITQSIANPAISGFYVNVQVGEVSVTNPEGGVLPEVFTMIGGTGGAQVIRDRFSSLSPNQPILTDAEMRELHEAATRVQQRFSVLYGENPFTFGLELEFKIIPPDRHLIIKQARPYFDR
ncbi:PEP/pyruvate-binding domain-containing protein, partial [Myxococcota bacterium]